jgi:methionine-rich copper-binding protein CopC
LVKTLLDRTLSPGNYEIDWDATNNTGQKVSGGIYYYTLEVGDFKETRKMVLLK